MKTVKRVEFPILVMKNGLSTREKHVLIELAKNSRVSDRDLASKLKTSQPTITRIRSKLMSDSFVDRFMILPNMEKLGIQFHAFTFIRSHNPATAKKMGQWAHEHPSVLFASEGEGLHNHTFVFESLHGDYGEYVQFIRLFREKFAGQVSDVSSFFMDPKSAAKFYHWHSIVEDRVSKLKVIPEDGKKLSRSERFRQALEKIPNPLEKIQNPLRGRESKEGKENKESSSGEE